VLSRLALLDIFVAFFVLCGVSCLVADRDWFRARLARAAEFTPLVGPGPRLWWRPWLLAAGVFWGLALGTKWAAAYPWVACGVLVLAWCIGGRRSFGVPLGDVRAKLFDLAPIAAYLVLLPVFVYVLTWTGWLLHAGEFEQAYSHTQYGPYWGSYTEQDAQGFFPELWQSLRSLWHYHHDVYSYHTNFLNDATHVYQSNPLGWLILNRPVGVEATLDIAPGTQGCPASEIESCLRRETLLGTPMLWWFGCIALVWSAVAWIGRRDWRYGLVVIGVAVTWLPWLRYDDRPIFSYYAIVTEPFLILGATMLLGEILGRAPAGSDRRRYGAIAAGTVVLLVVANFAFLWPVLTDGLMTNDEWMRRMWFARWV
jgi:dolichyl-phosphate-mannose--protein O-mannosyl transferase